jgi:hypothetical protein
LVKCSAITQAGTVCKGTPIDGSSYCYVHHPDHAEERRRHGSKGGKRGGRGRPLSELTGIKARLSDLADDVLEEKVDKGVAAVAGQVLNVYLRAVVLEMKAKEQLEVIGRLEALEKAASEHRPGGRRWEA